MLHEDVFKFIKVLTINPKQENALENFRAAMADNYGLGIRESVLDELDDDCDCGEHHHHHHDDENNYGSMARWVNPPPEAINKLQVGTMFKGITHDSLMFTYQILGETNEGEKLWYPVDNLPAVVVKFTEIDPNTAKSKVIFVEPTDVAIDMAMKVCKPGFFYQITDINDVPSSIFDEDDDDDEDDSPMAGIYFCYQIEGDDQVDFRSVTSILDSYDYLDKFQASYRSFIAASTSKVKTDTEAEDVVEQPEANKANATPIFNNDPDDFVF